MNPIIKWPGGKSREIDKIAPLIPQYRRYVEPFFGGGALFFHLQPGCAAINDISEGLMQYYSLIKAQDPQLHSLLLSYAHSFSNLTAVFRSESNELLHLFFRYKEGSLDREGLDRALDAFLAGLAPKLLSGFTEPLILDEAEFFAQLRLHGAEKIVRTVANYSKKPYNTHDLCENLVTGFTGGYYMYFRRVFNDLSLGKCDAPSPAYRAANFYFIREYCYGSMFRYNAAGEFNIPYGGMSYNRKDMLSKVDAMFNREMAQLFANTELFCCDFEDFIEKAKLNSGDFLFLDPPYDTDFSDYEGKDFTKFDQERLAHTLKKTDAGFILVIKNTPFINSLYEKDFRILSFDKQYTYNVRSRNDRETEHLIITNLPG